ncbi:MAG: hypothetical protein PUI53_00430, partial [Butyricicoccus porcorum]|nr:hypothetical protein [Butyricicoccus porcorum]
RVAPLLPPLLPFKPEFLTYLAAQNCAALGLSKTSNVFFRQQAAACCAHDLSAKKADSLHTCRPERIFPDVHAAGKNNLNGFRACGRETLRDFFDTRMAAQKCAAIRIRREHDETIDSSGAHACRAAVTLFDRLRRYKAKRRSFAG